jgi:hypothetical protein
MDNIRNNGLHKILKIITTVNPTTKEHDHRKWTHGEIGEKSHRLKFLRYKHDKVSGLCDILINTATVDRLEENDTIIGVSIEHPTYLKRAKEAVAIKKFKEPTRWWVWPSRILATGVAVVTILAYLENRESKNLKATLIEKEEQLKQLKQRRTQDSLTIQELKERLPKTDSYGQRDSVPK